MIKRHLIMSRVVFAASALLLPSVGHGQAPASSWEVNMYLLSSERAQMAAALEQASLASIGTAVPRADSSSRATGTISAQSQTSRGDGAVCRTYDVVVNVPARSSTMWQNIATGGGNAVRLVEVSVPLSPAFVRRFTAQACRTSAGAWLFG